MCSVLGNQIHSKSTGFIAYRIICSSKIRFQLIMTACESFPFLNSWTKPDRLHIWHRTAHEFCSAPCLRLDEKAIEKMLKNAENAENRRQRRPREANSKTRQKKLGSPHTCTTKRVRKSKPVYTKTGCN